MLRDFPQYSRSIRTLNKRMRYFGSRKVAPPSPNSNANPKPNPAPDRGAVFLGDNFPDSRYFNIFYHNKNVSLNAVKEAVKGELNGPGKLLGYRAMHLKIRQKTG